MRRAKVLAGLIAFSLSASASPLVVCLDFLPNPNHVPLFVAADSGRFAARGLEVELVVPSSASDPAKLAAVRAADLTLTPQINYLIARAEGLPLVAVGVLIDHSLGGLLAFGDRGIASLGDLVGHPIGYSLAPLEPALWRAMFSCAGVSPDRIDLVNVGYNTKSALLAETVDAIGAFRNVELVLPEIQERDPVFFAQEDFCVPETYELVFVANPEVVEQRRADVVGFLDAVEQSIAETRLNPDTALASFFRTFPELDDEADRRSFAATLPLYADDVHLAVPEVWMEVQRFLVEERLVPAALPFESLVALGLEPTPP